MSYVIRRRRGVGAIAAWDATPTDGETMNVSQASLDSILKATGGTPIVRPWGQTDILLPSGQIVNAGGLATIYNNPLWMGNQKVVDAEAEKVLNSDTCISEWGNVVSDCHADLGGSFSVQAGKVTYQAGVQPVQYQAPVLSQTQYAAWQQKNAASIPAAAAVPTPAAAPKVTSSNSASSAPGGTSAGGSQFQNLVPSLLDEAKNVPMWAWFAAAGAAVLLMQGGGRGR